MQLHIHQDNAGQGEALINPRQVSLLMAQRKSLPHGNWNELKLDKSMLNAQQKLFSDDRKLTNKSDDVPN